MLDGGCGLGSSTRYPASEHGCLATGTDLAREYVEVANDLAARVGSDDRVAFCQGSALAMPFDDGAFDIIWTEHVQMNIKDKEAFHREMARVFRPGGRFLFYDIFAGDGGSLPLPVPWAEEGSISFLAPPSIVRDLLEALNFSSLEREDSSRAALDWFRPTVDKLKEHGPPPLGLHLLMGDNAKEKFRNQMISFQEHRMTVT